MMTFKQWMKQTMRQYGRHYVVALFACCFLLPLLTGDQGMLWNTRRDVLLIGQRIYRSGRCLSVPLSLSA